MTATGRPYPMRDSNDPTPAAVIDPPPRRTSWQRLGAAGSATRQASILTTGGELATGKPYIERLEHNPGALDRIADALLGITFRPARGLLHDPARSLRPIIEAVRRHEHALSVATDDELQAQARAMRAHLRRDGFAVAIVGECFALITETASRTLGMRHYDVQLMAGWGLLQGKLVEMATGEGKSFAATLPAATVALAGYPVHVITVNDYLAERDAQEMAPLYNALGLTVDSVVQRKERDDRRKAYASSIVYTTNKDVAFDYLRDGIAMTGKTSRLHLSIERLAGGKSQPADLVLRGLHFGIVDEADSVFIDEARTPLILSASVGPSEEKDQSEQALAIARALTEDEDYKVEHAQKLITLEDDGKDRIATLCQGLGGVWTSIRAREELVIQALCALILFRRDQHYIVTDGKVQIVDESTGRLMPDRSWERGLHQLIEVKEGCEPTERRETLARITYQRLFRRYVRLAGMTGTGKEVAPEIRGVYGLEVARIPLNRPSRRHYAKPRVCGTKQQKWRLVVETVEQIAVHAGRPVLIGTRSVAASEEISAVLHQRGIDHALLNAMQDKSEAEIIAKAGMPGVVTVATNMAGRGTDIRLGPGVAERGGLHVVLTEYHESRRVDRQLFGRAARQGDQGSCEAIVSLEDELYAVYVPWLTRQVRRLKQRGTPLPNILYSLLKWLAQGAAERRGVAARVQNLKTDRRLDRVLAFSGRGE
jgi:preprotein translocase subunit SecA